MPGGERQQEIEKGRRAWFFSLSKALKNFRAAVVLQKLPRQKGKEIPPDAIERAVEAARNDPRVSR